MSTEEKNILTEFAEKFIDNTSRHIFLTGKAGTGKTTFLHRIAQSTYKNVVITAPTGIAAINAKGATLHSTFHLPFGAFLPSDVGNFGSVFTEINTPNSVIRGLKMNDAKKNVLREMELLIIDEVSMLRADLLDAIDVILRSVRKKRAPFGGVQILFIGDLHQLPPVVKNDELQYLQPHYPDLFFFQSHALKESPPVYIELEKIYRQSDQEFIDLLNRVRDNKMTEQDIDFLNSHYDPDFDLKGNKEYIQLTTHNKTADRINRVELDDLEGESFYYQAQITGDFNENAYPLGAELELKQHAKVMFVKNDVSGEGKYFNGKIGEIIELTETSIKVGFEDGSPDVEVEPYEWENTRFKLDKTTHEIERDVVGVYKQYPLKLAWAITVHKSQGLTFEKAAIDIADAFVSGQTYVALSRLTSLDGLVLLSKMSEKGFSTIPSLAEYGKRKLVSEQMEEQLQQSSAQFFYDFISHAFSFHPLLTALETHVQGYDMAENRSEKQKHLNWAKTMLTKLQPVIEVGEKFELQVAAIARKKEDDLVNQLHERVHAAAKYFEPLMKEISEDITAHRKDLAKKKSVKKYLKELEELKKTFLVAIRKMYRAQTLIDAAKNKTTFDKDAIKTFDRQLIKQQKKEVSLKKPTREISFDLYKESGSVSAVANERGMAVRTVEQHLESYVESGDIELSAFVSDEKGAVIADKTYLWDGEKLSDLKALLGDDYSYSEIRFVLAAMKRE